MDSIIMFLNEVHPLLIFLGVFVGGFIILFPRILILIPLFFIVLIYRIVSIVFDFIKIIVFNIIINIEISVFEKAINNKGLKNNIDIGACHYFFNKISVEHINMLFYIYYEKALSELESNDYDDEQIERYLHLLSIMLRCLSFKRM
ncbi:MAG: hypothetical protein IJZ30_06575 [Alphaproteobacteria bacterium]|nr:hypothetical protein [Alphaproteobacteria bacterium]